MKRRTLFALGAWFALVIAYAASVRLLAGRDPIEAVLVRFDALTVLLALSALLLRLVLLGLAPGWLLFIGVLEARAAWERKARPKVDARPGDNRHFP